MVLPQKGVPMRPSWLFPVLLATSAGCERAPGPPPTPTGSPATPAPTADGTPWTWRSDADGFELTIPSERWKVTPNPNVLARFDCPQPLLVASVIGVRPAGTEAEYEAAVAAGRDAKEKEASNVAERSGPNRHGRPHWVYVGEVTGGAQPYVFGASVTRVDGNAVLLMFEGPCRQDTAAGRAEEARALRAQADLFLGSVR
jgi:hypothetical protein